VGELRRSQDGESGNNVVNADGTGEMGDAYAYAGRLDYAMASNLNVWASYIRAHRLERAGTYGGTYGTADNIAAAALRNAFGPGIRVATDVFGYGSYGSTTPQEAQAWKAANQGGNANDYNPYVDDGFIGWELDLGMDWKLLEGLTVRSRYAYWRLGKYFDQANKAFTDTPQGSTGFGGNGLLVGRSAIQAAEVSFMIEF
jgi:hypothetical protein